MKSFQESRPGSKLKNVCDGVWQLFVLSLLAFTLLFFASEIQAAQIKFAPQEITVKVAPGETVTVPVSAALQQTSLPNAYVSFGLAHVGGTLDRAWLNNQAYITLNPFYKNRQVLLRLKVPANAEGGTYTGVLKTAWLRSNETVAPAELKLNVAVDNLVSCGQVPLFSDILSSHENITTRNNKQVWIELAGTVEIADGCSLASAGVSLIDEYGEMNREEPLQINEDGSFKVTLPIIASRKGNDKDGRSYTIKFIAANEAGQGESGETTIVVAHDNRKN